jgi:hypothetical protein
MDAQRRPAKWLVPAESFVMAEIAELCRVGRTTSIDGLFPFCGSRDTILQ